MDYLNSIVEKDVLAEIRRPETLRRFIRQLGARTANELNVDAMCGSVGAVLALKSGRIPPLR